MAVLVAINMLDYYYYYYLRRFCCAFTIIYMKQTMFLGYIVVVPDLRFKKGKAIPLQVLTGPEGSRRLRLPDFKTIGT
jgi:hypothetical protein